MNEKERAVVTQVKGFIEPIFIGTAPNGMTLNGVGPSDYQMIREGYACGECLAIFDTYTIRCPVCQTVRDVMEDIPAPQDWIDHLREREHPNPDKPKPRSPLEAIYGVKDDPDVEQIPVVKLRKRRH